MAEVKQVSPENIIDLYKICCPDKEPYKSAIKRSAKHFCEKMEKGWKGLVIYEGNEVVGRAEIAPVEESLVGVSGEDMYFLYCIWIKREKEGRGFGRKLMEEVIETAKKRKGLATVTVEGWMPPKFFEKFGFEKVQSMGPVNLMIKKFSPDAKIEFTPSRFTPQIEPAKVKVTVVYSLRCPYMLTSYNNAIETAKSVSDKVSVVEHIINTQGDIEKYGEENFYVDNESPFMGPIDPEKLQEIIEKTLKGKT